MKPKNHLKKPVKGKVDMSEKPKFYEDFKLIDESACDSEPTFAVQAYLEYMTKQMEIAEAKGESFDFLSRPTEPITFPKGLLDL